MRPLALLLVATLLQAQSWAATYAAPITKYLPLARMAYITGDVVVNCWLNEDGTVVHAEVLSGPALLKDQARDNALLWKFRRASPGDNSVIVTYQYRLEGKAQYDAVTSFSVGPSTVAHIVSTPPVPMIEVN